MPMDIKSFEELYKKHSGFVYSVAMRVSQNSADAQEITQDVFMKIYRGLNDFQGRSSLRTWIYRITVNTALNQCRKANRLPVTGDEYDYALENAVAVNSSTETLDKHDKEAQLSALIGVLSPEQRTVIILREIEGLSYQEIAESVNIPVNTVRTRLKRAREALMERGRKGAMSYEMR
jgi:RNA polymerase sigma-70 factor, ECF subfamily